MKISLALELPTVALGALSPLTDLDFAIAYRVLEDEAYARHYFGRAEGRVLILDNGFHELGKPAGWDVLRQAALLTGPDFIIVPDQKGPEDAHDNLRELDMALQFLPPEKLALVVAGQTRGDREVLVQFALDTGVGMLCFSRMVDRLDWFKELHATFGSPMTAPKIHLLGLRRLDELAAWRAYTAHSCSDLMLSVDTSKPAKAALLGRTLDGDDLRGMSVLSKTLFARNMDESAIALCRSNILLLRNACGG